MRSTHIRRDGVEKRVSGCVTLQYLLDSHLNNVVFPLEMERCSKVGIRIACTHEYTHTYIHTHTHTHVEQSVRRFPRRTCRSGLTTLTHNPVVVEHIDILAASLLGIANELLGGERSEAGRSRHDALQYGQRDCTGRGGDSHAC